MPFGEPIVNPAVVDFRRRLPEAGGEAVEPSTWAAAKAALKTYNPLGALFESERHRVLPDPDERVDTEYDPFADTGLGTTIQLFPDEFEQVRNRAHAYRLKAKLDAQTQNMATIRDSGAVGVAFSIGAALADPINLIPVGGYAVKARQVGNIRKLIRLTGQVDDAARLASTFGVKLSAADNLALANRDLPSITLRYGTSESKLRINLDLLRKRAALRASTAARGTFEGFLDATKGHIYADSLAATVLPTLASEGVLAATRETYETEEFLYSAAAAGVVGAALGAFRGNALRLATQDLDSMVLRISDEMQHGPIQARTPDSGKLTAEQIATMGPAKVEKHITDQMKATAPGTFDLVGENKVLRATLRDSPTGRLMSDVGEGSEEIRGLASVLQDHPALRRDTLGPSVASKIEAQTAKAFVDADNVDYLRKTAKQSGPEFDRDLILALSGETPATPEIGKAVNAARRMFDDSLKRSKEAGLLTEGLENYFPRFYLWDAIQADREGFVKAIAPYVGGSGKANKIVGRMLTMKDRTLLDPTNFQFMSEKGIFRARELKNVPTKALLTFIDTDVPNVMRRYARMANGQIEYAKLTPGDPLDGINLTSAKARVGEIMDARIAAAKPKAREALIRQKDRHLSDLEYIREIHLGDFKPDQFDTKMHTVMRPLRGIATMVYLPWAGVASLQDSIAAALHNSAGGFWQGSARWLKRQLTERVERGEINPRDLSRMARSAEYAMSDLSRASLLEDFSATTKAAGRNIGRRRSTVASRINQGSSAYLTWNGMRPANVMARQVAINTGADDLLHAIDRRINGATRKGDDIIFAQAGITDELANRISKEMKSGGFTDDMGYFSPRLDVWDPDTADDFSAALFQNAKLSYINPTAPILPKWVRTEAGAMFFQFLSTPWAMKNNYVINSYQRLMAGQIGRVAHGSLLLSGFGIAYYYLRAAADGKDLERIEFEDAVAGGIDRVGVVSMLEIANEAIYSGTGGAWGWKEFLGKKVQMDGFGDIPAFDAVKSLRSDVEQAYNFFTGERFSEEELKKLGNRIPYANVPWFAQSWRAFSEMMK